MDRLSVWNRVELRVSCRTADGLPVRLLDRSDHVVDRRLLPHRPRQLDGPRRLPGVRGRSAHRPGPLQPSSGGLTTVPPGYRPSIGTVSHKEVETSEGVWKLGGNYCTSGFRI